MLADRAFKQAEEELRTRLAVEREVEMELGLAGKGHSSTTDMNSTFVYRTSTA